jgi:hypothetical protein
VFADIGASDTELVGAFVRAAGCLVCLALCSVAKDFLCVCMEIEAYLKAIYTPIVICLL